MEKPNDIYITLYTSHEKLTQFTDGFTEILFLYDSHKKSEGDTIPLSVPFKWVWREQDCYYIKRKDFADQF